MANGQISCGAFSDHLIRYQEHIDDDLLKAKTPRDGLFHLVGAGTFRAGTGVEHEYDRLERSVPDLTGPWQNVVTTGCVGKPCDPTEKIIGFGSTRESYRLTTKSYATDLFCFDLMMTADRVQEQFEFFIEILGDASTYIHSDWLRMELHAIAGKHWVASSVMADYTFTWNAEMTEMTPSVLPTSKLTPPMLQRRVQPQINKGAMDRNPKGMPIHLTLLSDLDTLYAMTQGNAVTNDRWRFKDFNVASKEYYEYLWAGQVGNFMVKVDLFPIRFKKKAADGNTLVRIWPFKMVAATLGVKAIDDDDYYKAPYQISHIHHYNSMIAMGFQAQSINAKMPYMLRDFAGKWTWAMHDLGADRNGCPIDNTRRNKGKFFTDFRKASKKKYPEFQEAILHLREPMCVANVGLCDETLTSSYGSDANHDASNTPCPRFFVIPISVNGSGAYQVAADTIECNGQAINHAAINAADRAALLIALNAGGANTLGTWTADPNSATNILVTGTACIAIKVPFVAP